MAAGALRLQAPAKINLTLHVCGRRADGYHLLDSAVVFAGVGDRVSVSPAADLSLALTGPFAGALTAEPDNLVLRAARLLAEHTSMPAGARIVLEKNLPVASGIGGGSADAAATWKACARLWGVNTANISAAEIARRLGADVPVCLAGTPAFMSGIGEILAPTAPLPPAWLVLVNPGLPLATKAVFAALNGRYSPPMTRAAFTGLGDAAALARAVAACTNDLMAPAADLLPDIGDMLAALAHAPGCLLARMSGSGPTCFGLFARAAEAEAAARDLARAQPRWWAAAAPMLHESPAFDG